MDDFLGKVYWVKNYQNCNLHQCRYSLNSFAILYKTWNDMSAVTHILDAAFQSQFISTVRLPIKTICHICGLLYKQVSCQADYYRAASSRRRIHYAQALFDRSSLHELPGCQFECSLVELGHDRQNRSIRASPTQTTAHPRTLPPARLPGV